MWLELSGLDKGAASVIKADAVRLLLSWFPEPVDEELLA